MSHRANAVRMLFAASILGLASTTAAGLLTGCGAVPQSAKVSCTLTQAVLPATATADHSAASPGNQQAFNVGFASAIPGCPYPLTNVIAGPQNYLWVSSDPIHAPISNAKDATAGVATCVGATTATISTSPAGSSTPATLTCE